MSEPVYHTVSSISKTWGIHHEYVRRAVIDGGIKVAAWYWQGRERGNPYALITVEEATRWTGLYENRVRCKKVVK